MVEDPGTSGHNRHENREISRVSIEAIDRSAKAQSHNADMHALEESDCCVVPVKSPNKEGQPSAEAMEGRRQALGNDAQSHTLPAQSYGAIVLSVSGSRLIRGDISTRRP
jgi:hypothetical protein